MCTLHVSVDIIFGHSCVNPQMWIAVYISMTNLLFHIVFLKHHEKQMLIKRCKALHPGEIIDQKKVSSRPSARPDMRHRVATVLGNLLRQQLWVIVTSKFVRLHLTLTLTLTELTLNLFGHRLARCRIGVGIMPCGYTLADVLIFFLIPIRWQMEISCSFLHLFNNLSTYPLAIFEFMSCWYRWPVYLTIS